MSKEELSYRALYQHALTLEKERLLLEESTSEEARRKTNESFRNRAAAMEKYHMEQVGSKQQPQHIASTTMQQPQQPLCRQKQRTTQSSLTTTPLPLPYTTARVALRAAGDRAAGEGLP